jgi:mediator of replication checkpoint protein 1
MSSPAASPSRFSNGGNSDTILTPSRRVKALLAQFDDSDSEDETLHPKIKPTAGIGASAQQVHDLHSSPRLHSDKGNESEDADEAILPSAPRGRLAARLQAQRAEDDDSDSGAAGGGSAYQRVRSQIQRRAANPENSATAMNRTYRSSGEDELSKSDPRRRPLKRKSSPVVEDSHRVASSRSPSPLFFPSPSAPKSPAKSTHPGEQSDLDDLPSNPLTSNNSRFLELVEKHRKQRLAQEAADIVKRATRVEQLQSLTKSSERQRGSSPGDGSDEDSDLSDHGISQKLSKASRPTRKASKKAIEEMNRETQRMTRNMQLAHQAKTKKKITKESLLARFNFPLPGASKIGVEEDHDKSATASSAPTSDAEGMRKHDTPPTSPLLPDSAAKDTSLLSLPPAEIFETVNLQRHDEEGLPTAENRLAQPGRSEDRGKGRAVEEQSDGNPRSISVPKERKEPRPIRVKWSKEDAVIARAADSDSDLEIVTSQSKSRKLAVFETLPSRKARETPSHLALRSLAHITDSFDKTRSCTNTAQVEAGLRKAARLQARKEREEKIAELKAKGIVIQSAEEREKDQQEMEDLVERARQEAAEIQKREQATAKRDGTFLKDALDDDDDESDDEEDGDFGDDDDAQLENADEEDEDEDGDEEGGEGEDTENEEGRMALDGSDGELIDQEAAEQSADEAPEEDADGSQLESLSNNEEEEGARVDRVQRRLRNARVLSDDEDDGSTSRSDPDPSLPAPKKTTEEAQDQILPAPAKTPQSVPRSARKLIPGLQMSDDLPMGLTQAFAATMADSQSGDTTSQTQEHGSYAVARELPSPGFPIVPSLHRLESLDIVADSQPASQTQPLNLDLSLSQSQLVPQSPAGVVSTQLSQGLFEPTQDVGFLLSPFAENRFDTPLQADAPPSTIETVILPRDHDQSPILQRKGRLRRGRAATLSDDERGDAQKSNSAFDVMRRAAARKDAAPLFDKSASRAKEIVDEAAEESEDEYAGLGGASDDDVGEENEDDRKMIDHDERLGEGDEAKLAGLFA